MLDDIEELTLQVSHFIPFIWLRGKGCVKRFLVINCTYVFCFKVATKIFFAIYGLLIFMVYWKAAYSEPYQTFKMELFVKIENEWKL